MNTSARPVEIDKAKTTAPTTLPKWAQLVREKYLAGEASTFVLYRNVFDSILVEDDFVDLSTFLTKKFVAETKKTVIEVSSEFGVRVLKGIPYEGAESNGPQRLIDQLHGLEKHLRSTNGTMVLVPYADTLMPSEDSGIVSAEERLIGTLFHRWSLDRQLNASDNIVIIVSESLGTLNQSLLSNPKVAAIEIPMPDFESRLCVVKILAKSIPDKLQRLYAQRLSGLRSVQIESIMRTPAQSALTEQERETLILRLLGVGEDLKAAENPLIQQTQKAARERATRFAGITAGMTEEEIIKLVQPEKLLSQAEETNPDEDVLRLIQSRKRELIEKECAGLIAFVEPKHGLDCVGGAGHITDELMQIAQTLKSGDTKLAPMGLLAVGPMGAGKTFVIKAFLKEAGLSAVALTNFRSKWVGSTERNLERVLATVEAMGPIAVLIDEGDRSFGNSQGEGGDDGTSSRVIARLKDFMSNTDNRGKVLFILLTNRPDKLDTDIKRPGRLDRKIPFFYCDTAEDRASVMTAVVNRYDSTLLKTNATDDPQFNLIELCGSLNGYSNADLEAVALLGLEFMNRNKTLSLGHALKEAAIDFIPPQERNMIDYMELLAVSEASRRSLLPARFKSLSNQDIQNKLTAARHLAL